MFLLSKDYRLRAWNKLNGKWNRIVVPTLVVMAINFVVSMVPFFGSLATLIIAGPLSLGIIVITLKIIRNNNDEKDDLFYVVTGFDVDVNKRDAIKDVLSSKGYGSYSQQMVVHDEMIISSIKNQSYEQLLEVMRSSK